MDTTTLRQTAQRARVNSVLLIWPDTELPAHLREMLDAVKYVHPGARAVAIKVRPDALQWIMSYLDRPLDETPPMIRSLVGILQRHGIRELPALIVNDQVVAVGDGVEDALRRLVRTPPLV